LKRGRETERQGARERESQTEGQQDRQKNRETEGITYLSGFFYHLNDSLLPPIEDLPL